MSSSQLQEARRLAGLELNALRYVDALPAASLEGARIAATGTPVHDLSGELLFYRFPVLKRGAPPAFVDIAAHPAVGAPLIAVSSGFEWNAKAILSQAATAARRLEYDATRFVAYSFPKVGVQFLNDGKEVLLLELATWAPVPPAPRKRRKPLQPSNFERWSLLEELPAAQKRAASRRYNARVKAWSGTRFRRFDPTMVSKSRFDELQVKIKLFDSRELHYSPDDATHHTCYELYGQLHERLVRRRIDADAARLLPVRLHPGPHRDCTRPRHTRYAERVALRPRRGRRHTARSTLLQRTRCNHDREPRFHAVPKRDQGKIGQ